MIRAVLFDFDGTVADTIGAIREGVNLTMARYGFPRHTYDEVLTFINNGARELIRRALPAEYRQDEEFVSTALAAYNEDLGKTYLQTDRTYDGVDRLIRRLHDEGFRIGVLSNKQDPFVAGLCRQDLYPGSFDATQGVEPGLPTKPDPAMTLKITEKMGVTPAECIMVGDSDVDILTAANAGMTHVGVAWGYRDETFLRANGARYVARDTDDLYRIIRNVAKGKED